MAKSSLPLSENKYYEYNRLCHIFPTSCVFGSTLTIAPLTIEKLGDIGLLAAISAGRGINWAEWR
jgi:hypothetical protein